MPLIARWPGKVPAGKRSDALYTPMDHLPTLCALAGIDVPGYLDGVDLSAALLGGEPPKREAVLMMNPVASLRVFKTDPAFPEWRGVRTGQHTYVSWRNGREELFDDREDPYQLRDLAGEPGAALNRSREHMRRLMAAAHDGFPPGDAYGEWYDDSRSLLRTALGPVPTL